MNNRKTWNEHIFLNKGILLHDFKKSIINTEGSVYIQSKILLSSQYIKKFPT